jgi:hypothetical protein
MALSEIKPGRIGSRCVTTCARWLCLSRTLKGSGYKTFFLLFPSIWLRNISRIGKYLATDVHGARSVDEGDVLIVSEKLKKNKTGNVLNI